VLICTNICPNLAMCAFINWIKISFQGALRKLYTGQILF
jgi:hypothetical protein